MENNETAVPTLPLNEPVPVEPVIEERRQVLRNEAARRTRLRAIITQIHRNPGITEKDLHGLLDVAASTINQDILALVRDGIIVRTRIKGRGRWALFFFQHSPVPLDNGDNPADFEYDMSQTVRPLHLSVVQPAPLPSKKRKRFSLWRWLCGK